MKYAKKFNNIQQRQSQDTNQRWAMLWLLNWYSALLNVLMNKAAYPICNAAYLPYNVKTTTMATLTKLYIHFLTPFRLLWIWLKLYWTCISAHTIIFQILVCDILYRTFWQHCQKVTLHYDLKKMSITCMTVITWHF